LRDTAGGAADIALAILAVSVFGAAALAAPTNIASIKSNANSALVR
jgi:hypothetical protein